MIIVYIYIYYILNSASCLITFGLEIEYKFESDETSECTSIWPHWAVVVMSHPSIRKPKTSPVAASVNMSTFFFHRFSQSCVITPSSDWNAQELSSVLSLITSMCCVGVHCWLLCFRKLKVSRVVPLFSSPRASMRLHSPLTLRLQLSHNEMEGRENAKVKWKKSRREGGWLSFRERGQALSFEVLNILE